MHIDGEDFYMWENDGFEHLNGPMQMEALQYMKFQMVP